MFLQQEHGVLAKLVSINLMKVKKGGTDLKYFLIHAPWQSLENKI